MYFLEKSRKGDIAFSGNQIAGIGAYEGKKSLMQKEDMRHLDLSTVTSILNLLM